MTKEDEIEEVRVYAAMGELSKLHNGRATKREVTGQGEHRDERAGGALSLSGPPPPPEPGPGLHSFHSFFLKLVVELDMDAPSHRQ